MYHTEDYFREEMDFEEWKNGFAHRLRKAICDTGMTQYAAAAKCGIEHKLLNKYINGKCLPNTFYLSLICGELNINAEWLLLGKE